MSQLKPQVWQIGGRLILTLIQQLFIIQWLMKNSYALTKRNINYFFSKACKNLEKLNVAWWHLNWKRFDSDVTSFIQEYQWELSDFHRPKQEAHSGHREQLKTNVISHIILHQVP